MTEASGADHPRVVVIGVGNALRRDDGAGLEVVRRLARSPPGAAIALLEQEGEPLGLLEMWHRARAAVLVDAIDSGAPPGTIRRVDASFEPISAFGRGPSSTHAVGVGETIELARAIGRLPDRVVVYGVEGECFGAGSGLSEPVQTAVKVLAHAVLREARRLSGEESLDLSTSGG